jgi:hypothetical protein
VASLEETTSLESTEEVDEGFTWLLASQSKEKRLPTSTRVKNTFFDMTVSSLKGFIKGPLREP